MLYDHAACRYVNTPSAYDTAVYGGEALADTFLPPGDMASRRFVDASADELLVLFRHIIVAAAASATAVDVIVVIIVIYSDK